MAHRGTHGPEDRGVLSLSRKGYLREEARLQGEMVALQEWIRREGRRLVVVFEGRDTAGKGGTIKRLTASLNPRTCRVVALPAPDERERTQWYFQRYVEHLPAAGEIVIFDRSWYNRAGVERVMGFCTAQQYADFARTAPLFERLLMDDGIVLVKYWLSLSDGEQRRRFQARIDNPRKRWKLSPMDLQARSHWVDYAEAKDAMFAFSDLPESPWWVIDADDKRSSRLNVMSHLLSLLPYEPPEHLDVALPPLQHRKYRRPPREDQHYVPVRYVVRKR